MSNFAFVATTLPSLSIDCARAEEYLISDPRTACFYSRRAAEELVGYLYDVRGLALPYANDLSARISDPAFRTLAGLDICAKLTLIRKAGNEAVHEGRDITPRDALGVLKELHHVVVWASFHHSPHPEAADGSDGLPLALLEAKRTRKSAGIGQQQAKLYADCLEAQFGRRPVIFYSNGYEHWLWDDAAGCPPRPVQGATPATSWS